jgi:nuclear receptor coactivator 2
LVFQISSTLLPYPSEKAEGGDVTSESAEVGPCLMCVARRIPQNEKQSGVPFEQFTTKLDTSGKIIGVDTSGVSSTYSQYLNKVSLSFLQNLLTFRRPSSYSPL